MTNPFDPGYWREGDLRSFGFQCGDDVMVAKNCTIIGVGNQSFENITIGSHVRIDGYTTIAAASGFCHIGSHVHIAGSVFMTCGGGVTLDDFVGVSGRSAIYTTNDDYSGGHLTGPTIPKAFLNVHAAPVRLGRHVVLGSGSTVLPGVEIGDGAATGAQTLVTKSLMAWGIYVGAPAKLVKRRSRELLFAEDRLAMYEAGAF